MCCVVLDGMNISVIELDRNIPRGNDGNNPGDGEDGDNGSSVPPTGGGGENDSNNLTANLKTFFFCIVLNLKFSNLI